MPRAFAPLLGPRLATALIFLVHASCVALLFRPVSGLWSAEPVIEQDWGTHHHHLLSLSAFWKEGGRLWGYDPAFMAGPPGNTIQDASVKLFELGAFKLLAFLSAAALPWLVHAAA